MMISSFLSDHWRKLLFPVMIIVVLIFLFIPRGQTKDEAHVQQLPFPIEEQIVEQTDKEVNEEVIHVETVILVDVQGAVTHPGVYSLNEDDRVIDAIQAAGGYKNHAESRLVNHAMKLSDEMLIYIPTEGEEPPEETMALLSNGSSNSESDEASGNGVVNLNTATEVELMTLAGIGPSKATAIIQYREENGPFQIIEDVMNVSGIGEKTFEALQQDIMVK